MSWYVDGYIEAPEGTGRSGTKYLAFVSQDPNAGAKRLAGPFASKSAAQSWADSYNQNPSHQSQGDIPHGGLPDPGASVTAVENLPGAVENLPGDVAKAILGGWVGDITGFHGQNFVIRAVKIIVGATILIIGLSHLTGAENAVATAARKVPVIL